MNIIGSTYRRSRIEGRSSLATGERARGERELRQPFAQRDFVPFALDFVLQRLDDRGGHGDFAARGELLGEFGGARVANIERHGQGSVFTIEHIRKCKCVNTNRFAAAGDGATAHSPG